MKSADSCLSRQFVKHACGSYSVVTGVNILHELPGLLPKNLVSGRACIVADTTVARLYEKTVSDILEKADIKMLPAFRFRPGEKSKSFSTLQRLLTHMASIGTLRNDFIVALGGGVTGDLAGFAASIYMRGISFIQIPTTLLAQADSSIGGKTAINLTQGKNLVGTFHAPELVICDLKTLDTLSTRHIRNGLAEIIKMTIIGDPECFEYLEQHARTITRKNNRHKLAYALKAACRLKCRIVEKDEKESGIRTWLNLGHTFGHAMECSAGYGKLMHGEAVGMGILAAGMLAVRLSICHPDDVERIRSLLLQTGLPVRPPDLNLKDVMINMTLDKKNRSGLQRLVLPEKIGKVTLVDNVDRATIEESIRTLMVIHRRSNQEIFE